MKKKFLLFMALFVLGSLVGQAQEQAKMLRFPAIHGNTVVFSYAGDLYKVDINGGVATKLTNDPDGLELFARFSPDGKTIAFTGQYDGNTEVYVMPSEGGVPRRLTYTATLGRDDVSDRMGPNNIVMTWKDNENVVFRSRKQSFDDFVGHLFIANVNGGLNEQLPFVEGSWLSYSPDGKKIAFNRVMREFRTWKYYRGGMADDIWIFDFDTKDLVNVTNNDAQDIFPMWAGDKIYFCSDRDRTMNLFVYDTKKKQIEKVTDYTLYDIKFPSLGDKDIVYENGGMLYRYNLEDGKIYDIPVQILNDEMNSRPKYVDASKYINSYSISPDGNRLALGARGDVWTVPAKSGITRNITKSDNAHDRDVAWSPDGKYIAYISDRTGEDELYIQSQDGKDAAIQLTTPESVSSTYKSNPVWSPDGKKILWYDKMNRLNMIDVSSKKVTEVAKSEAGEIYRYSWSPDSKWIAYVMPSLREHAVICIYNVENGESNPVTDNWFSSSNPVFDLSGDYLYFTSERDFNPDYSWTEWNHSYNDMTRIYLVTLRKDIKSPFITDNDEVTVEEPKKDSKKDKKDSEVKVSIDFDGIVERIIPLPVEPGSYWNLVPAENGLYYVCSGNDGGLNYFDIKTKKSDNIGKYYGFEFTPDMKKMLVSANRKFAIVDAPKSTLKIKDEDYVSLDNMKKWVDVRQEWAQIYKEAWRQMRDYFYAPNMHGVDWNAMYDKYAVLVPYAGDRNDVNYLIGELIGELNIGHAYVGGGDRAEADRIKQGLLGAQLIRDESGFYKITKILKGESWNKSTVSPLREVGVDAKEGDFIVAVDGVSTQDMNDIYESLVGKANTAVVLSLNEKPELKGAHDVVVKTIDDEHLLYYYNWVQDNIRKVDEATDGQVGYIHIPDMGPDGLNEFVKYFYPQLGKKALIIDDRGNGGGNVSPMIIERLRREIAMYNVSRNCGVTTKPSEMMNGPKVLLLNKYSASDGDLFPWQFKYYNIGKTIGTRSWGGVVGIRGSLPFIDGGFLNRPEFAPFDSDGNWIIEGHGVDPDIVIDNNPYLEFNGEDAQLNKAIEVILEELKNWKKEPAVPDYPDKSK